MKKNIDFLYSYRLSEKRSSNTQKQNVFIACIFLLCGFLMLATLFFLNAKTVELKAKITTLDNFILSSDESKKAAELRKLHLEYQKTKEKNNLILLKQADLEKIYKVNKDDYDFLTSELSEGMKITSMLLNDEGIIEARIACNNPDVIPKYTAKLKAKKKFLNVWHSGWEKDETGYKFEVFLRTREAE